ncbi:MAG: hypothetical protein ACTSRT_19365 [Promethearchaeota archaeon]
MVRIEWTERSLDDLNEIRDYIARDSKSYANLFIKKLYNIVVTTQLKLGKIWTTS